MSHSAKFSVEYGVFRVIGGRNYQEDEYTCLSPAPQQQGVSFFGVYDGHGTDEFSLHASKNLHKLIFDSPHFKDDKIREAFVSSFEQEDKILYDSITKKEHAHGGSTATVAVVKDNKLYLANVGDSRAVVAMRSSPDDSIKAYRISHDHKTSDPKEAQRIVENEGEIRGDRVFGPEHSLNMTRALGDHEYKAVPENLGRMPGDQVSWKPYISPILNISPQMTPFLIMASDGLWDNIDDHSAVSLVLSLLEKGHNCKEICEKITKQCGKEPHSDNVTMVLVRFVEPSTANQPEKV